MWFCHTFKDFKGILKKDYYVYSTWVGFNKHMTTIARARNSVQTNSIDRKNRTQLRQWRPFPSCYHAINWYLINKYVDKPMDWCGQGFQLLIASWHDDNGLVINMWNYLPPNTVLPILWLPSSNRHPRWMLGCPSPLATTAGPTGGW